MNLRFLAAALAASLLLSPSLVLAEYGSRPSHSGSEEGIPCVSLCLLHRELLSMECLGLLIWRVSRVYDSQPDREECDPAIRFGDGALRIFAESWFKLVAAERLPPKSATFRQTIYPREFRAA